MAAYKKAEETRQNSAMYLIFLLILEIPPLFFININSRKPKFLSLFFKNEKNIKIYLIICDGKAHAWLITLEIFLITRSQICIERIELL